MRRDQHAISAIVKRDTSFKRAQVEYEKVTDSQTSRLRLKLADVKVQLRVANERIHQLETQHTEALFDAVIEHQKRQKEFSCGICWEIINSPDALVQCGHSYCHTCILNLLKSSTSPIFGPAARAPSCPSCRHSATKVPIANYELESAVEALINADVFEPGPAVKRAQDDYKKWFPVNAFNGASRPSGIASSNFPAYRSRQNMGREDEWGTSIWRLNA
ncbi:hypothetical protein B0H16DRAFT_1801230 [Mycena metata]|uniref:RING-type domain-containing protein n=1 Tax=Mycena metata TaxID=1033252 RepID=A0AAD7JJN0_9AGAR|nr:hypothetical protein B0H16DRAFT_1801230 [Mycena metata]